MAADVCAPGGPAGAEQAQKRQKLAAGERGRSRAPEGGAHYRAVFAAGMEPAAQADGARELRVALDLLTSARRAPRKAIKKWKQQAVHTAGMEPAAQADGARELLREALDRVTSAKCALEEAIAEWKRQGRAGERRQS
eukprot:EG_transcript_40708